MPVFIAHIKDYYDTWQVLLVVHSCAISWFYFCGITYPELEWVILNRLHCMSVSLEVMCTCGRGEPHSNQTLFCLYIDFSPSSVVLTL